MLKTELSETLSMVSAMLIKYLEAQEAMTVSGGLMAHGIGVDPALWVSRVLSLAFHLLLLLT